MSMSLYSPRTQIARMLFHPSCLFLIFPLAFSNNAASEDDRVSALPGLPDSLRHLKQYAGLLDASTSSVEGSLFYWLVEKEVTTTDVDDAPLVLWLQGGPGASSMFGLFTENGPFRVAGDARAPTLAAAAVRWTQAAHMLYLDQPFGTGFSFASNASVQAVVHDEEQLRDAAVAALLSFFARHRRFAGRPFYIFGESFAGHMAPNIAWRLLQLKERIDNSMDSDAPSPTFPVDLHGLAIGDGWVDPIAQNTAFPTYAFSTGLISDEQQASLKEQAAACVQIIEGGNYTKAFHGPCYYQMLNPIVNAGGGVSPYDIRVFSADNAENACSTTSQPTDTLSIKHPHGRHSAAVHEVSKSSVGPEVLQKYLDSDAVRDALHLPRAEASAPWGKGLGSDLVELALIPDLNAPTSLPLWPSLMARGVRLLVYNGNFDLICNHIGTDAYVRQLQWPGRNSFLSSARSVWRVPGRNKSAGAVAGWARSGGNLTQVVVANAGHMAPGDAPEACLDLLQRFLEGRSFSHNCTADKEVLYI